MEVKRLWKLDIRVALPNRVRSVVALKGRYLPRKRYLMDSPYLSEYFSSNSNYVIQIRNHSKCKYEIVFWVTSFKWVSPQEELAHEITTLSEYLP